MTGCNHSCIHRMPSPPWSSVHTPPTHSASSSTTTLHAPAKGSASRALYENEAERAHKTRLWHQPTVTATYYPARHRPARTRVDPRDALDACASKSVISPTARVPQPFSRRGRPVRACMCVRVCACVCAHACVHGWVGAKRVRARARAEQ